MIHVRNAWTCMDEVMNLNWMFFSFAMQDATHGFLP